VNYERRARLAVRHRKVPAGRSLIVQRRGRELELRLEDAPESSAVELAPVPVPESGQLRPVAREFREDREHHRVSRGLLPRAARIVSAIAQGAEGRGWTAKAGAAPAAGGWELHLDARDPIFRLRLFERGVQARGPWEARVAAYRTAPNDTFLLSGRPRPHGPFDSLGSGRLSLELRSEPTHLFRGRQWRWGDRASWQLEARLGHVFVEIEERLLEIERDAERRRVSREQNEQAMERKEHARSAAWQTHMQHAAQQLVQQHREAAAFDQADAWRQATDLRHYCDAAETRHGRHPDTAHWLRWVRAFADRIDPLQQPPGFPEAPAPTPEALQAHLPRGWSARGPESPDPRELPTRRRPELRPEE
jgi:hypothetical protein